MPRVNGRVIRPATLAERRLFLGHFGTDVIRVPRAHNPYAVARRIRRLVMNAELTFLYALARRTKKYGPPLSPDVDTPEPAPGDGDANAGM